MPSPATSPTATTTTLPPPPEIWHTTTGTPGSPTLLLLHGLFSSHLEFRPLLPYLTPYYFIILVDLPGHSNSHSPTLNTNTTYRFPESISALATLIKSLSPSGTAHVAGLSYGGFLSLSLAGRHPDVVASLFTSGSAPWAGKQRFVATRPWLLWCVIAPPILYVPDSLFAWLLKQMGLADLEGLREESKRNFSSELMRAGFEDCAGVGLEGLREVGGRGVNCVVVAGGRQDDVEGARRAGRALREGSGDGEGEGDERGVRGKCKAFVVRKAIHAWDLQFPELFAQGIRAWIEGRDMPGDFEELV